MLGDVPKVLEVTGRLSVTDEGEGDVREVLSNRAKNVADDRDWNCANCHAP